MILGVIQARMASTRFPGKVLKTLLGEPMLMRQLERVQNSKRLEKILVASSTDAADDAIEDLCKKRGFRCFRGDHEDVLDRFYRAASSQEADHVVRLTGDCPLSDPVLIDDIIRFYLEGGYDYAGNVTEPTFPDGLDVEVFNREALEKAWQDSNLPSQREHVTPYIYQNPRLFKIGSFKNRVDLSDLRWTVDEVPDFELITKIFAALYPKNPRFGMEDTLKFLARNPELKQVNTKYRRNEGYLKSLARDKP